jgi:hypothetical protein
MIDPRRGEELLQPRGFLRCRPTYRCRPSRSSTLSKEGVSLIQPDRTKLTCRTKDTTWVTLATAHPAKFSSSVEQALSTFPEFNFRDSVLPSELKELESLDKRIYRVKGEQGVRELIEKVKRGEEHEPSKEGLGSL